MSVPAGSSRRPVDDPLDAVLALVEAAEREGRWHLSGRDVINLTQYVATVRAELDSLTAQVERWLAWSGGDYPDDSPGDVISAHADGTIILDDAITTWNPKRAAEWFAAQVERLTEERDEYASLRRELATILGPVKQHHGLSQAALWIEAVGKALGDRDAEVSRLTGLLEHTTEGLREARDWIADKEDIPSLYPVHKRGRLLLRLDALLAVSSRPSGDTEGYRERAIEEDFYLDPKGEWVYRWNDSRWVLRLPGDIEGEQA